MTLTPAESEQMKDRAERHHKRHGGTNPSGQVPNGIASLNPDQLHVIYIAGAGRSGSTLLGDLLGSTPGVTHAGELRYAWQRGFVENRLCACSERFAECAFWTDVRDALRATGPHAEPSAVAKSIRAATRIRNLATRSQGCDAEALDAIHALYRSVATESNAHVIVDSSKLPPYARLLDHDPRFRVSIVHLVRDPRGVVSSWSRVKAVPDTASGQMQQMSAVKASLLWTIWNAATARWWSNSDAYVCVRYEDFLQDPARSATKLMATLGYGPAEFSVSNDGVAELGANFGVAGNPDRFATSRRQLRLDERWKEDLSSWKYYPTTAITAPLLRRFRYPLRVR